MSDPDVTGDHSQGRRIYVDIDDVLSQTLASLTDLLAEVHGRQVSYEEVTHFDLGKSFGLDPQQIEEFFDLAHQESVMRSIALVEGAPAALGHWHSEGYEVHLLTGRPPSTEKATRQWLADHAIPHASLSFVDKDGRAKSWPQGVRPLTLHDVAEMEFCLAVEDSLEVAAFLAEHLEIEVALMDRPWNRDLDGVLPKVRGRLIRCHGWSEVIRRFPAPSIQHRRELSTG